MLETFRQWLTDPILYILILPSIGFGIFIIVLSIRGLLRIKRWEYKRAYAQVYTRRYLTRMSIGLVIAVIPVACIFIVFSIESRADLPAYISAFLIGNAFFLYFIVLEIIAIYLARKRLRELSADGLATTAVQPNRGSEERGKAQGGSIDAAADQS